MENIWRFAANTEKSTPKRGRFKKSNVNWCEKALRAIAVSDTHSSVAVKKRARKSKGRQHPLHAESLDNLAHDIQRASTDVILKNMNNAQCFTILSNIIIKEAMRVRGILR